MARRRTWAITDHLCRYCGGRVLQCATGAGPSAGGNPLFRCALCGESGSDMAEKVICWCGQHYRNNFIASHMCVPFSAIDEYPGLRHAFLKCGSDPERRGEIGIMLVADHREAIESREEPA